MFLVGMFELWGVDDGVVGTDDRENDGGDKCDADRGAQGGDDGVLLELKAIGLAYPRSRHWDIGR